MDKPVIIFGAKGIGKAALEIFESNGVVVYGFLDEDEKLHKTEIGETLVLGDPSDHGFLKLIGQKCEAFVATDDNADREDHVSLLKKRDVMPTNAIHQNAVIAKSSSIGNGNFINAGVIVGADSIIGQHNILNSGVLIEQDVQIGDFVQIGSGTKINLGVQIADKAFIGSGVTIVAGVEIGKGARIGAGSVVVANVGENETVFGNPAAKVGGK